MNKQEIKCELHQMSRGRWRDRWVLGRKEGIRGGKFRRDRKWQLWDCAEWEPKRDKVLSAEDVTGRECQDWARGGWRNGKGARGREGWRVSLSPSSLIRFLFPQPHLVLTDAANVITAYRGEARHQHYDTLLFQCMCGYALCVCVFLHLLVYMETFVG